MTHAKPTVIYILSAKNSGSTMLEAILSSGDGCTGVGELNTSVGFWGKSPCSCGLPDSGRCGDCRFVLVHDESQDFAEGARRCRSERGIVGAWFGRKWAKNLASASDSIYERTAARRHATTVVDSSKNVARALCLRKSEHVRTVYLVRNPASYVASREARSWVRQRPALVHLLSWAFKNTLIIAVAPAFRNVPVRIAYEDIITRPTTALAHLSEELQIDLAPVAGMILSGTELNRPHLFEPSRRRSYQSVRVRVASGPDARGTSYGNHGQLYRLAGRLLHEPTLLPE